MKGLISTFQKGMRKMFQHEGQVLGSNAEIPLPIYFCLGYFIVVAVVVDDVSIIGMKNSRLIFLKIVSNGVEIII